MKLSLLSILLGVGVGLPQVYGLVKPAGLAATARNFPRNLPAGVVLMLLATVWFAWNVNNEPIADFSAFKPYMLGAFVAVGVLSCFFVQDFLAVRGLAVLLLLLAKTMLDTGRPYCQLPCFTHNKVNHRGCCSSKAGLTCLWFWASGSPSRRGGCAISSTGRRPARHACAFSVSSASRSRR